MYVIIFLNKFYNYNIINSRIVKFIYKLITSMIILRLNTVRLKKYHNFHRRFPKLLVI